MNRYAFLSPTSTIPPATSQSGNHRLYSTKELTTDHGLNAYNFEARWLAPAFPCETAIKLKRINEDEATRTDHNGIMWDVKRIDATEDDIEVIIVTPK